MVNGFCIETTVLHEIFNELAEIKFEFENYVVVIKDVISYFAY